MKANERNERLNELWEELIKIGPTNEDLCWLIQWAKPLRKKAWKKLLERGPTNNDLLRIVLWVKPLRKKAWRELLERGATFDDLNLIAETVESLKSEALHWVDKMEKIQKEREEVMREIRRILYSSKK